MPLPSFLLLLLAVVSTTGLTLWLVALTKTPAAVLGLVAVIAAAVLQLLHAIKHHDRPQSPTPGTDHASR